MAKYTIKWKVRGKIIRGIATNSKAFYQSIRDKDVMQTYEVLFSKFRHNPMTMGVGISKICSFHFYFSANSTAVLEEHNIGPHNAVFSDCDWPNSDRKLSMRRPIRIGWYGHWLHSQKTLWPPVIKKIRDGKGEALNFNLCFISVSSFVKGKEGMSIDDIIRHLQEQKILGREPGALNAQRLLIFAILGYQSMLYLPAYNVCPLSELAISQHQKKINELFFTMNKVSVDHAEKPIYMLLNMFGDVLPCQNIGPLDSMEHDSASTWFPLRPSEINAHLLWTLLDINIVWVDTLGLHLHYDKPTKTLSLFKYPSFCVAMLNCKGAIYSFGCPDKGKPYPTKEDISKFLKEVSLSYRLLFGQVTSSRNYFRLIKPKKGEMLIYDETLRTLCTHKEVFTSNYNIPEDQSVYFSSRDFPMLYSRLVPLARELQATKPNSMIDILRDRRDKLQYWTFLLVAIVGGISIILSFIQVLLQGIEVHGR